MKQSYVALLVGTIFGFGLAVSGMTQPQKVIGFLDIFGQWDPALAFVMIGAIAVHLVAYRLMRRRTSPLLADQFMVPSNRSLDKKLVAGAFIFGIGWGLGGYCPGPALTSLVSLQAEVMVFVVMMALGMFAHRLIARKFSL